MTVELVEFIQFVVLSNNAHTRLRSSQKIDKGISDARAKRCSNPQLVIGSHASDTREE